jgi:hypothetical protein
MDNIKYIVSSGCSIAYGDELQDRNKRNAKLIADHYNAELFDFSLQGCSNEIIANSIIDNVLLLQDNGSIELDKTFVLVEWTIRTRLNYYSKSNIYHFLSTNNMREENRKRLQKAYGHDVVIHDKNADLYELKQFWLNHTSHPYCVYNMIKLIHHTQSFLKSKNIKYVFYFLSPNDLPLLDLTRDEFDMMGLTRWENINYHERENWLPDFYHIVKDIDKSKIADVSIDEYCRKRNFKYGSGNHPLEEAHEKYSKYLINFIENEYGV